MEEQLDLFGNEPRHRNEKAERIDAARDAAPENIALLYTCTACGNSTGGHFFMEIDDAKKFCDDDRSRGVLHGTPWAFFWTSLKNYCGNYWDLTLHGVDFSKFCDNGTRDKLCDEIGVHPLNPLRVFDELERGGISVKRPPLLNLNPRYLEATR